MISITCLRLKVFLLVLPAILLGAIEGQSAEIIKAFYDSNSKKIKINAMTLQWCNDPKYNLVYLSSGRAIFGPHYYRLEETPVYKKFCRILNPVEIELDVPEMHRRNGPLGNQLVISGDKNTSVSIQVDYDQNSDNDNKLGDQ